MMYQYHEKQPLSKKKVNLKCFLMTVPHLKKGVFSAMSQTVYVRDEKPNL